MFLDITLAEEKYNTLNKKVAHVRTSFLTLSLYGSYTLKRSDLNNKLGDYSAAFEHNPCQNS